jgi:hypothetical protein
MGFNLCQPYTLFNHKLLTVQRWTKEVGKEIILACCRGLRGMNEENPRRKIVRG